MRQENIDHGKARRKREAVRGAMLFIIFQGIGAVVLLWARTLSLPKWLSILMLVLAVGNMVTIPPVLVVLKQRMKEIEGGELDAARKY